MEQQIRFCATADGVRIAYATVGSGQPLVLATGWPVHLELEWQKPFARSFLEKLAEGFTLVRYDMRALRAGADLATSRLFGGRRKS